VIDLGRHRDKMQLFSEIYFKFIYRVGTYVLIHWGLPESFGNDWREEYFPGWSASLEQTS